MRIASLSQLTPAQHELFCLCLENRDPEVQEAGTGRRDWVAKMRDRGLRAQIALDDAGTPVGFIQVVPSRETLLEAPDDLDYVLCLWVPNFGDDRGDHQGHGIGSALLSAAEDDARIRGATGIAVSGLMIPVWMRARWFKKHGYRRVDRIGLMALMWKPFTEGARPPRYSHTKANVEPVPGQVQVTCLNPGWCRGANASVARCQRAVADVGPPAAFRLVDTSDVEEARRWGDTAGTFISGKRIGDGRPLTYDQARKLIAKAAKKELARHRA